MTDGDSDGWKRDYYFSRERVSARTPRFFIHPSSSCNNEKKKDKERKSPLCVFLPKEDKMRCASARFKK